MAFFESHLFSEMLGMNVTVNIVLPQTTRAQIGLKGSGSPDGCPVLYLLHGQSDDETIWLRRTSVERYASERGIALVMPNAHRSYYTNQKNGLRYWDFISDELPALLGSFFKVSQKREDTFVAGLSMGGFGTWKLALNKPEKYAAVGCFSSVIRPDGSRGIPPQGEFDAIFGSEEELTGSESDLYDRAEEAARSHVKLPAIYDACGTEDFLFQDNLRFKAHLEACGIPFTWHQEAGAHSWDFWERQIQNFLKFLDRLEKD